MLDTGSEVTFLSISLVEKLSKRPIVSHIMESDGTLIDVLKEMNLPVILKGREIVLHGVVSYHVAELLLGIDWLETNGAVWDMRRGELYMKGLVYTLKPKTNRGWCARWWSQRRLIPLPPSKRNERARECDLKDR